MNKNFDEIIKSLPDFLTFEYEVIPSSYHCSTHNNN